MSKEYAAPSNPKRSELYRHITAAEQGTVNRGRYHGEVHFAPDGIPRQYTVTYYHKPEEAVTDPFETTYSVIRIKNFAGWTKRKDAPYIRRAILDASPVARPSTPEE